MFDNHERGICGRCYTKNVILLDTYCLEKPENHFNDPMGKYHCPDCGTILQPGMAHPRVCMSCRDNPYPLYDVEERYS